MDPVVRNILDVAFAEFANAGLKGARIESIAAKTNTSKRMIYYHFGSKEGLYSEVLEHAYRLVRQGASLTALADMPPLDALASYAGNAFDNFNLCPDFIRLVVQENVQGAHFVKASKNIGEMNRATFSLLQDIVERGKADGSIRQDVTSMNVYTNFIGLCHYNISSRNSFLALFDFDLTLPENSASRRASICDLIVRYVRA